MTGTENVLKTSIWVLCGTVVYYINYFFLSVQYVHRLSVFFSPLLRSIEMSLANATEREKRYLTTGNDIQNALSNCKLCYKITNQGDYVIFHTKLPSIIIPKNKRKMGFIVNSEENPSVIGHWFSLIIFGHFLVLCDSLCIIEKQKPNVMKNIMIFCDQNHLKFLSLSIQIQQRKSLKCGFLSLNWIARASTLKLSSFISLKKVLMKHSVRRNEKLALEFAKKHFKIKTI